MLLCVVLLCVMCDVVSRACEQECEASGQCEDIEDFDTVLRAYPPAPNFYTLGNLANPRNWGLCVLPFQEEDYPPYLKQGASYYCKPPLVPTRVGCSNALVTESVCIDQVGGVFHPRRHTRAQCRAAGQACNPLLTWPFIGISNGRNESSCAQCDGGFARARARSLSVYISVCVYVNVNVYLCVCVYVKVNVYLCVNVKVNVYLCVCVYVNVYLCVCVCVCECISVCMCVCVYVCM
jgi:hypothetical protein